MTTSRVLMKHVNALRNPLFIQNCKMLNANRGFCTASDEKNSKDLPFQEINVPVPWGHVSCVRWGPENKQPIIALHGWQDNAFSFKRLVNLMPPDIAVLGVDYPGHGNSSWYPTGMYYRQLDIVFFLQRIIKYFGWKTFPLMAHSMGAIGSFTYASLFPDDIKYLISIDNLKPLTAPVNGFVERLSKSARSLLEMEVRHSDAEEPPAYTMDEMIEKLYLGGNKSIDKDKCYVLLQRGTVKSKKHPGKYCFTRDPRLKHIIDHRLSQKTVKEMAHRIKCPILHFKFESWTHYEPIENHNEIVNIFKENNKHFEKYVVPGSHHGHVNNPEVLFPVITDFIKKHSD